MKRDLAIIVLVLHFKRTYLHYIKKHKEKFIIQKGVQDTISVNMIYEDGIFLIGKNKWIGYNKLDTLIRRVV